ncbi:MAG: hypothetical protein WCW02_04620 [Candidatus Buchananbacteria bacterium]
MNELELKNLLSTADSEPTEVDLVWPTMQKISTQEKKRLFIIKLTNGLLIFSLGLLLLKIYQDSQAASLGYLFNYWWQDLELDSLNLFDNLNLFWQALPLTSLALILTNTLALIWATKFWLKLKNLSNNLAKI